LKSKTFRSAISQAGLAAAAALTVVFTAQHIDPVFLGREPAVRQLLQSSRSMPVLGPNATRADSVMARPTFEEDRRRFAEDLVATGRVTPDRADELAKFAVREAYMRDVPPALVFGVMMVENDAFKSTARSSVGAIGLMQIYPKVWVNSLGKLFGRDLRNDETNIQYGVYILGSLLHASDSEKGVDYAVRRGLLRYNGCVRGTNTKDCFKYPDKVRDRIERYAQAQCGQFGYSGCVTSPLRLVMAFRDAERQTTTRQGLAD
jgi:soluble lytic murein transglycosylase-like protein